MFRLVHNVCAMMPFLEKKIPNTEWFSPV